METKVVAGIFLCCCFAQAYCGVGIPAILFSGIRNQFDSVERPGAAQVVTSNEFTNALQGLKKADVTIVFVQDEMSPEDFLKQKAEPSNEKVFPQLETLLSSTPTLYYSAVKSPTDSISHLTKDFDHIIKVSDNQHAIKYLMKAELKPKTLVIISLSPTSDEEFLVNKLRENDRIIGEIIAHLTTEKISFNAIYTAHHFRHQHEAVKQTSRHLLSTTNAGNIKVAKECFLLYLENLSINNKSSLSQSDVTVTVKPDSMPADCENLKEINVTIADKTDPQTAIQLNYAAIGQYWALAQARLGSKSLTAKENDYLLNAHVLLNRSYHCNARTVLIGDKAKVSIEFMQVQAFVKSSSFSTNYVDCVGFFTAPLWMSLILSLVFISITCCGVGLLHNVSTFDRFDDPKGKQLTVTISE